jgi:hypothetical protein
MRSLSNRTSHARTVRNGAIGRVRKNASVIGGMNEAFPEFGVQTGRL